ncbi:tetratricopeptide repeat protein [Fulvivirga sedimenti]|uniref:Tetratricopeptide repeat protein n=1 Tax=Fulvivirga sedimenti TaxID=2879465 RepID=A0A9X1HQI0_9BACT|nr:tetratricopeptide repeat protein [Fulvivirga sedimenti]MCA6074888.1 tetratricopeptide repeat protein [Fulvivirga sedimenti]MCA6076065.1 tetratricopeptide repeat protein [Fulvivirga sedimenti]MCA6077193.1 tetratricopeptide repeat protein [Fulvivirga sedimenti]
MAEQKFDEGLIHWAQRDYSEALKYFNDAIRIYPRLEEGYLYRADCRAALNDNEGAIQDYILYLNWFPENREALFSYSELNYRQGHYEQARDGFLRLKKLPGGVTNRVYYRQKANEEGVEGIFTTQTNDRSFLDNYLGLTYRGTGQLDKAISYFDSALFVQPENSDYLTNRAVTYLAMGMRTKAEQELRNVLIIDPGHTIAKNTLAMMIDEEGDSRKAIEFYSEAIADNPNSPHAYRSRGRARLLTGANEAALKDFNEAIELDPDEPTTWLNRGIVLMRLRFYEEAFADFSRAIELRPNMASAYLNRGNVLYQLEEYGNALNDYEVALMYQKDYPLAHYHKGITLYNLGRLDEACKELTKATGLSVAAEARRRICPE